MCGLTTERADAASLEAQAVQAALFGADIAKPLRCERGFDPTGEEK